MCMICVDWEMGKLSFNEAFYNLSEVFDESDEHHLELWAKLVDVELLEIASAQGSKE